VYRTRGPDDWDPACNHDNENCGLRPLRQKSRRTDEIPHSLLKVCTKTGLGQGCDRMINGRWDKVGSEARRAYPHLVDHHTLDSGKGLADATYAGTAVHVVDSQREFWHSFPPAPFDDIRM
jgi:hypothetical protein